MHIVWMVLIGLVVGAGARLLIPGRDPVTIVTTMLLGVTGSIVAGFIGRGYGWYHGAWEVAGFVTSVVGAMALILPYPTIENALVSRVRRR